MLTDLNLHLSKSFNAATEIVIYYRLIAQNDERISLKIKREVGASGDLLFMRLQREQISTTVRERCRKLWSMCGHACGSRQNSHRIEFIREGTGPNRLDVLPSGRLL
jgi:hypothetical protein